MERKPQQDGRNVAMNGFLLYLHVPNKTVGVYLFKYCVVYQTKVKGEKAWEGGR